MRKYFILFLFITFIALHNISNTFAAGTKYVNIGANPTINWSVSTGGCVASVSPLNPFTFSGSKSSSGATSVGVAASGGTWTFSCNAAYDGCVTASTCDSTTLIVCPSGQVVNAGGTACISNPPTTSSASISPTSGLPSASFALSWSGDNTPTSFNYRIDGGNAVALPSPPTTSSSYTATGLGWSAGSSHTISTQACNAGGCSGWSTAATYTVLAPAPAPTIGSFTNNGPIVSGSQPTLSWSGVANATACSINNGVGSVTIAGPSTTVAPIAVDTTYTLTCSGATAPAATITTTVTVLPASACSPNTINNCSLPATGSGSSAGSCDTASGYSGLCSYSCNNGSWTQVSNTCVFTPTAPTVISPTVTNITSTDATLGANVTGNGGAAITERGTCIATTPNPSGSTCWPEGATTLGVFTHARSSLLPSTTYYYRGYARNSVGYGFTPDRTFTTSAAAASPDIVIYTNLTPLTAIAGIPVTLQSTIGSNNAGTGVGFSNIIRVATAANGGGAISTLTSTPSPALLKDGSAVTSASHIFPTAGTYSAQACADMTAFNVGSAVTESSEGNNCGNWMNIVVSNTRPTVTFTPNVDASVVVNTGYAVSSIASDVDGNLVHHEFAWQRPDGQWNYDNPIGGPQGSVSSGPIFSFPITTTKSNALTFTPTQVGTYSIHWASKDSTGSWDSNGIYHTLTVRCQDGYPYDINTASCVPCGNTGCDGGGGDPTNPPGGTICRNGGAPPLCTPPTCANGANNPPTCANSCNAPSVWNTTSSSCVGPLSITTPSNSNITLPTVNFSLNHTVTNKTGATCYLLDNNQATLYSDTVCNTSAWVWNTPAIAGTYGYYVRATKAATGETKTSNQFTVTVSSAAAATIPTITSLSVDNISTSKADIHAKITSDGGSVLTERGTCIDTSPIPPAGNSTCWADQNSTALGDFTITRTSLIPNTTYHYRGYARNAKGYGFTPDGTFTTPAGNSPPAEVTIDGPASLQVNESGVFGFKTSDPDGDSLRYEIDWNNNWIPDWTLPTSGYTPSNTRLTQANDWGGAGPKTFSVRAVDSNGSASGWSVKSVTICLATQQWDGFNCVVPTTATANFISVPATCDIPLGGSQCTNVVLTFTSSDVTGVDLSNLLGTFNYCTNLASGNQSCTVNVPNSGSKFTIRNTVGKAVLATSTMITANCAAGSHWDVASGSCIIDTTSGTLSPSSANCEINDGQSTCAINFTWNTVSPVGISEITSEFPVPGSVVATGNNQGAPGMPFNSIVGVGIRHFYLYNNAAELDSSTLTSTCKEGSAWYSVTGKCMECDNGGCTGINPPVCNNGGTPPLCSSTGTLTADPVSCTIPFNNSTCASNFSWTVANPVAGKDTQVVADANGAVGTLNMTPESLQVRHGATGGDTFRLYHNSLPVGSAIFVTATCTLGTQWDSINGVCADPQITSFAMTGNFNYTSPEALTFTCGNFTTGASASSKKYEVLKNGSTFISERQYNGPVTVDLTSSSAATYGIVCIQGDVRVTRFEIYNPNFPQLGAIIPTSYPKTINAGNKTTVSWSIINPQPSCRMTAKPVCTGGLDKCSAEQIREAAALQTVIDNPNEYIDKDQNSQTQRRMHKALTWPYKMTPEFKALGSKTFTVQKTTDFEITCGAKTVVTRVNVANSEER